MKLDSRVLKGKKPLTCFDAEQARNFVGKKCYLTNDISLFSDLNEFKNVEWGNTTVYEGVVDTLTNINTEVTLIFETSYRRWKFCIPCEWVKAEKKYRPFSLAEFLKIFDVGDQIGFRSKDNGEVKHAMFVGYTDDFFADNTDRSDGENDVMIGIYRYSFSYLFENYDLYFEDEWQPFGIEE